VLIPELDTAILRSRDDPLAIMRDGHREHIVLMAGGVQHALAEALVGLAGGRVELPILECLVERAGDEALAVGRERDRIDRVAVPAEAVSQMRMTASSEPAATNRASGEIATLVTPASTFGSSSIGSTFDSRVFMSHIRAVLSPEPETMSEPSCEKSSE
jgi:hypothetical protein